MPRVLLSESSIPDISAEIPFLFKKAGCSVDVYAPKGSWLLRNSYWDAWYEADTTSAESYAKGVAARAREGNYDWVVFTEDKALQAIAEDLSGESDARMLFPLVDLQYRDLLGSKAALSRLCEEYGIPTPLFAIGKGDTALLMESAQSLTYPLLLKLNRSSGGTGVFLCEDDIALREKIDSLTEGERKEIVLQEFIHGIDIAAESLFWHGKLLACASSQVIETVGNSFSVSVARQYAPNDVVEQYLRNTGKAFGFHGFCNATFRQETGSGKLYLIEADQRPNIWFASTRFAGVDFSEVIRNIFSGRLVVVQQPKELGTISVRHFHREVTRALMHKDYATLLQWLFNKDGRWKFIPLYDPKLLLATFDQIARTLGAAFLQNRPRLRALRERARRSL